MHADRTNRVMLTVVGLIALAAGIGGLLAAGGVFGSTFQHKRLFDNGFSRYVGDHGTWLWPAIAAVTLVLTLLVLRWLLKLLFSTDRTGEVTLATSRPETDSDRAAGRTTMQSSALTQAVAQEIETYHGVNSAKARTVGRPTDATLVIEVSASRRSDLPALLQRIESEAISHAREAMEQPDLAVKLDIAVTDKGVTRTS